MKKILLIALIGLSLTSCTKEDDNVSVPTFDVSVEKQTYALGDTVRFKFSGDADYLTMYSGEAGSRYENRNRLRADGTVRLEITTRLQNTLGPRSLWIYATTDLNPLRDSASIVDANWTDISDRYNIVRVPPSPNAQVNIGTADLSDIVKPDKPLFIAFKAAVVSITPTSVQDRWVIGKTELTNEYFESLGTRAVIGNLANMDWKALSVKNDATYGFTISATNLNQATAARNGLDSEHWVVSSALYPDKAIRDYPTTIKNQIELIPEEYPFTYSQRGTYKVVFVALNSRNGQTTTTTKEVEITIE